MASAHNIPPRFVLGFSGWRSVLDAAPVTERLAAFNSAVVEVAGFVANQGLDRVVATDELSDIAASYALDTDAAQNIIAKTFEKIRPIRDGKPNGHDTLKILSRKEFIAGFTPPNYLIARMLQRKFIYSLTGQTGHAKTAIALLLSELVGSRPTQFLGVHRVQAGRVLYMIGENPDDLRSRVIGGNADAEQIYFVPGIWNIEQTYPEVELKVRALGGVDLVIVDTSAAFFFGDDEISNTQMGAHARKLRRLTLLPGDPCVLVLCHPIKYVQDPSQLYPRGGGAFLAEMDGNLTSWKKDESMIELHHNKIRGPGFEPMTFKIETVWPEALVDADGTHMPTVRVKHATQTEEDQQRDRVDDDDDRMLVARLNVGDEAKMSITDFAKRWGWKNDNGDYAKSRVHRSLGRLVAEKFMHKKRGEYLLTDKGKDEARKAALRTERADEAAAGSPKMQAEMFKEPENDAL